MSDDFDRLIKKLDDRSKGVTLGQIACVVVAAIAFGAIALPILLSLPR